MRGDTVREETMGMAAGKGHRQGEVTGLGVPLPLRGNTAREETLHGKGRCKGQLGKAIAREV